MTVVAFALLGAVTGALTAAILLMLDFKGNSIYIVPGLVFGIAVAIVWWRRWRLAPARAAAYVVAVGLANAAAVFVALFVTDDIGKMVGKEPGLAITGALAGAVGAGLATGMARRLIAMVHWLWPIAMGAILGAMLQVFVDGEEIGVFVFYMVWQAGFAAATAATLPPLEKT